MSNLVFFNLFFFIFKNYDKIGKIVKIVKNGV